MKINGINITNSTFTVDDRGEEFITIRLDLVQHSIAVCMDEGEAEDLYAAIGAWLSCRDGAMEDKAR